MKALFNARALTVATLATLAALGANAQTALDTSFEYDAMGRPTVIRNAATYASETMQWDALGRLVSHANRAGESTSYTYAGSDAPTSVQAPNGAATVFDVDGLGLTRKEISPDRGTTDIVYDGAGNPVHRVDARGNHIDISFDVLNRPTEARYTRPDGSRDATHSYTWDSAINGIGRIARVATDNNALEFEYDAGGRVAGRTYTRGERVLRTRAFHNAADGNLDVLTYPSGSVITYHYDAAGQLVRLEWDGQPIASNIEYAPFGPPTAYQLANGIEHGRTHDSAGRINSYTLAGAVTDIGYDTSGNIAQLSPRTDPGGLQTFQFDGAGRVTRHVDTTLTETFTYDANANRTSRAKLEGGWQTTNYNYTPYTNRVTAIGGATLTHDAAGNRVTDVARGYTYNAAGRLTKVRVAGVTTRYEYNGLGERVYKYVDTGLTRHYAYDTAGHLIGEYDASGAPVAEYAWLGDLPVAMRATRTLPDNSSETTLYAIETDHLGTPRALTDPAGQLRWRWHSAPFGDTPPNANPAGLGAITFNLRFPGQYYDAESGLHYNYFRDYDPGTGRYVQSDPIGLMGGMNTYGYVGGNPLGYYDPYGLFGWADMPTAPDWLLDGVTGWGAVLSFGLTNQINTALGTAYTYNQCSAAYQAGQALGFVNSIAIGGAAASRSAVKGWANFSHAALPNRYLKQFANPFSKWLNRRGNLLNGQYISWQLHARLDPFAYRMLSAANKQLVGAPYSHLRQALNRVPYLPGSAAYGAGSIGISAGTNCGCGED